MQTSLMPDFMADPDSCSAFMCVTSLTSDLFDICIICSCDAEDHVLVEWSKERLVVPSTNICKY